MSYYSSGIYNKKSPLYGLRNIFKIYFSALISLKKQTISKKENSTKKETTKYFDFNQKKIQMKSLFNNIPRTTQSLSSLSIDCLEKLKTYYNLKKEKYYLGRDHIKSFYLKRKELKYDFKEWKSFLRNSIVSLFLASNLFYFLKNRKSDKLLGDTLTFIKYSGTICLATNFLIQKHLNRYYKKEILKYQ